MDFHSLSSYEDVLENLYDGLYCVDENRKITFWNKAAERITGFMAQEVIGKCCADNLLNHVDEEGHNLCRRMCPLAQTLKDGKIREHTLFMHTKDGHRLPVSARVSPLRDVSGALIGGIELFSDISDQVSRERRIKELEKLAFIDKLTQLANRSFLEKQLAERFRDLQQFDIPFGILFMDIDHFKCFNDTYGHDVGDRVLQYVAKTFASNSRSFDLYGRWGGEEFLGIIPNIQEIELQQIGERVRMLVEHSFIQHGTEKLSVTISVGAALARKGDSFESLIKRADTLLYECKSCGRNCLKCDYVPKGATS